MILRTASAALLLAGTVAAAATPAPTFPPLPFESPRPASTAGAPLGIPEIGRVRSARPACTAIRDLVVPSFSAALKADDVYAKSVIPQLDKYADANADPNAGVTKTAALFNLDRNVSTLFDRAREISDALGDPRVAPSAADPEVRQVRAALQNLYAAQMARAGALSEFVQRETLKDSQAQLGTSNAFDRPGAGGAPPPPPPPTPDVSVTPIPGMPILHGPQSGLAMTDRSNMRDWATTVRTQTRARENLSAKTFYTIAKSCR